MPVLQALNYLMASFKALPGLKAGIFDAAISISSPVCGLRPLRAARVRTSKLPKPINCTLSPFAKVSWIDAKTASTAAVASIQDTLANQLSLQRRLPILAC